MQKFKFCRTSTNNESRSGRPADVIAPEIIKKILRLVEVNNILPNRLQMQKLCAGWMLRVFTDQQKLERADVS